MAKRRRLKKSVKRVMLLLVVTIAIIVSIKWLPFSHAIIERPTKYSDQYINGIVFTDIEFYKNKLSYCHHRIADKSEKSLEYAFDIDGTQIKIDKLNELDCSSISLDSVPKDIVIIETTNNTKSVLSNNTKEQQYNKCVQANDYPYEKSEILTKQINELDTYLKKTNTAVYYENLNSNFTYGYNETKVFYGASLIKLPEALYLIDEAINGKLSLKDTVTLTSYYRDLGNAEMKTNAVNSKVSIEKLIKYELETSDNGAHLLLFDTYAGKNIAAYEESIGSPYPYSKGSDKFGYQTAEATNVYLKHAYEIITTNEEYGPMLKKYMVNNSYNYLDLNDGIEVAHKYGLITKNPKYHDIGIVFNKHPYTISILTYYPVSTAKKFVQNVHTQIKSIHELYYTEQVNYCLNEAYFVN